MIKKAFTLVELLIVIAIMAILAAISVPSFQQNQALDQASIATVGVENILKDIRLKSLLNRKCIPTSSVAGVNTGGSNYSDTPNSLYENKTVLFISADEISVGCGFVGEYNQYNIVESYSLSDFGRLNVNVYMNSDDSTEYTQDDERLLKIGENVFIDGESTPLDNVALVVNPYGIGSTLHKGQLEGSDLKFKITIPDTDYKRTVCFYGRTLLTTSSVGDECEEPLSIDS